MSLSGKRGRNHLLHDTTMFRSVELPEGVTGHLYLHSMPGRYEALQELKEKIAQHKIERAALHHRGSPS
jgi:hypothetical protein